MHERKTAFEEVRSETIIETIFVAIVGIMTCKRTSLIEAGDSHIIDIVAVDFRMTFLERRKRFAQVISSQFESLLLAEYDWWCFQDAVSGL